MEYLTEYEREEALKYFQEAIILAKKSTCLRAKCGSVIVKDKQIIGKGFNSPPQDLESQRKCSFKKTEYNSRVTDKTCCIHAEQRAIIDALIKNPEKIEGSKLFFIRIDDNGNMSYAGKPYCTICSKMALDTGIKEFILYHEQGIATYNTEEYNTLSYQYN